MAIADPMDQFEDAEEDLISSPEEKKPQKISIQEHPTKGSEKSEENELNRDEEKFHDDDEDEYFSDDFDGKTFY